MKTNTYIPLLTPTYYITKALKSTSVSEWTDSMLGLEELILNNVQYYCKIWADKATEMFVTPYHTQH